MLINRTNETILTESLKSAPEILKSAKSWALFLQKITFHPDFGRFFNRLFDRPEKMGYISISFDHGCYFPNAKLNLNFSKTIQAIHSGESIEFDGNGLPVFPEKKVHEKMYAHLFFFSSKMDEEAYQVFQQGVNQIVEESYLVTELDQICQQKQVPNKERLEKMSDLLNFQIECAINNSKSKFMHRFNWIVEVKDEWSYFGNEEKEEKRIKLKLLKKCY